MIDCCVVLTDKCILIMSRLQTKIDDKQETTFIINTKIFPDDYVYFMSGVFYFYIIPYIN